MREKSSPSYSFHFGGSQLSIITTVRAERGESDDRDVTGEESKARRPFSANPEGTLQSHANSPECALVE